MEQELYFCPRGCEPPKPLNTLRKWKRHMSVMHGGFLPGELAAATGGDQEGVAITGETSFDNFAASMPEDASELRSDYQPPEPIVDISEVRARAEENARDEAQKVVSKKVRARLDSFKKKLTGDWPMKFFAMKGIDLLQDERDMIRDAFDMALEMLDIQIEVQPLGWRITNPLYIIAFPFVVCFAIFGAHILKQQGEQEQEKK